MTIALQIKDAVLNQDSKLLSDLYKDLVLSKTIHPFEIDSLNNIQYGIFEKDNYKNILKNYFWISKSLIIDTIKEYYKNE